MRTAKQQRYDRFKAKDGASKYHWDRMTKAEKEWLIAFEVSEHEAERGKVSEAVDALLEVGIIPSDSYVQGIRGRRDEKANPQRAESGVKRWAKRHKTNEKRNTRNVYDSSDFVRVMRGAIDKDDLSYEPPMSKSETFSQVNGHEGYVEGYKVEKETSPDNCAVMINPEDGLIEAIDAARAKGNRSLEKLIEDAKLSKEAKEDLIARTQTMTYTGMTYTFHGTQYMNLNYVLRARNGQLYVQDQHDRIQTLALYLKRHTADSYATHAIVSYPSQPIQTWVFKAGHRSNVEGSAIQWVS